MGIHETSNVVDNNIEETIKELVRKQEELKRSEEKYRIVAEATKDIIWEGDLLKKKRYFSGKLYEILGYTPEELEDFQNWFDIVHPEDIHLVKEGIRLQIVDKIDVKAFEYRVKSKEGKYKWLSSSTKCEFNENGEAVSTFGAFTDVTELKEQQKKIQKLAYYDSVTGLPNRIMFSEVVTEIIEKENINKNKFSIIFMDLDNFKFINDCYGHPVGDELLLNIGKRLIAMDNTNITSFRSGGDEFIILIKKTNDRTEIEEYLEALNSTMAKPFHINEHMFYVTHSSGVVCYPRDGESFQELLKNADTAMYRSKELGRNTSSFYNEKMGETAREKAEIQGDLHRAIENKEFQLYYQPIVDVQNGKIKGCEALIRWIHPQKGIISPGKFIPVAEENGTIIRIGKWVLESACSFAKNMRDRGYIDFYVSINVSSHQLLEQEFTKFVLDTFKESGVNPNNILIEITESVFIEYMDLAICKLKELKEHKIRIALDDFGCGYSSLTYVRRLPIDILKIDRSFISDIESLEDKKNMTNIIILMASQLGLKVISEGVEEEYQLSYLKKHSCDMFQGYLVSKPLPEKEFIKLIL
ncbi:hypothetical protein SDC9_61486 [bioreactor metagenome]|uniref:Signaling protein n=1 Tax=bioreactor metagenome TaxID=1076179 RepID=A0A644XFV8_9ZZZZ